MELKRYKLYNGGTRYKLRSPSFNGKGSFVFDVVLTVTEDVSAHHDVTCFDGADGSITVMASGGTSPYVYSIDPNFSTTNSTGVFTGLSVSGPVYESTDQYGGIVVCHKMIYAKDANGRIGHIDVPLQSPVELHWVLPDNQVVYFDQNDVVNHKVECVLPFMPHPTTTANGYDENYTGPPSDNMYYVNLDSTTVVMMRYECINNCNEYEDAYFTITFIPNISLSEDTSVHQDVTCFDGSDGSITVVASGGAAPYQYSLDPTFASYNSTGVFDNLAITGPVTESTDEYGGILICTKTIYVRDANNHVASLDVQLKSPVELEWIAPQSSLTVHCDEGQNYATVVPGVDFVEPVLSTTANHASDYIDVIGRYPDNHYFLGENVIQYYTGNLNCYEEAYFIFTITVLTNE